MDLRVVRDYLQNEKSEVKIMAKVTGLRNWRNGEIINARDYVYERNQITTALNTNDDTLIDHEDRLTTAEGLIDQTGTATRITVTVKNNDNTAITIGMPVYIFSTLGASGTLTVKKATADHTIAPVKKLLGVVMDPSIAPNGFGEILILGELTGLNTNGLTQGQPIYVGTTPGTLTSIVPTEPNHRIIVGVCAFTNANNGAIYVKQQLGLEFGELDDVRITNVQNGQLLRYNTANLRWENSSDLPANSVDLQNHIDDSTIHHLKGVANGVASLDANTKIPIGQMPDAVFDSLYFNGTASGTADLSDFASEAVEDGASSGRSALGYYWVATASLVLSANTGAVQVAGKYYTTVISPSEEGVSSSTSSVTLETGDWVVISKITGAGTVGSPYAITFAVVNNTYEIATTLIDGIVRLSDSTSLATTGNKVITDGRLNALLGNVNNTSDANKPISTATQTALDLKADLTNGKLTTSQIPDLLYDTIFIRKDTIYTSLADVVADNGGTSNFDRRFLALRTAGAENYTLDVWFLPRSINGNNAANYTLQTTIGSFASPSFKPSMIISETTKNIYYISSVPATTVSGVFLPTAGDNTLATNQFFTPYYVRNLLMTLPFDNTHYRIASNGNSFNSNDNTKFFYAGARRQQIGGTWYEGSIFHFTNNFFQFEDFVITRNGSFDLPLNRDNTTWSAINTTIFQPAGSSNWETSESGNHKIWIIILNPDINTPNVNRIVIIEKI
jgi:hypothetical protein